MRDSGIDCQGALRFGGSSLEITSQGLNHTKLLLTNAERHFSRIFSARGNTFNSIEFQDFVQLLHALLVRCMTDVQVHAAEHVVTHTHPAQSCMAQTARQRAMMRATALHCKRQPPSRSTSRARRIARMESGRQQHSSRTRCLLPWHHGCSDASSSKRGGSLNASCGGGCK